MVVSALLRRVDQRLFFGLKSDLSIHFLVASPPSETQHTKRLPIQLVPTPMRTPYSKRSTPISSLVSYRSLLQYRLGSRFH